MFKIVYDKYSSHKMTVFGYSNGASLEIKFIAHFQALCDIQHGSIAFLEHHEMSVCDFNLHLENIQ